MDPMGHDCKIKVTSHIFIVFELIGFIQKNWLASLWSQTKIGWDRLVNIKMEGWVKEGNMSEKIIGYWTRLGGRYQQSKRIHRMCNQSRMGCLCGMGVLINSPGVNVSPKKGGRSQMTHGYSRNVAQENQGSCTTSLQWAYSLTASA